jgi:AraC-like DNA-binding protein
MLSFSWQDWNKRRRGVFFSDIYIFETGRWRALAGSAGRETDILALGALEGCDAEAVGGIRRFFRPQKFLIESMNYHFRRPALKRYCTQDRFVEMLDLESVKAVNREYGGGESPVEGGINVNYNRGKAGELLFYPGVPVEGIRVIICEGFYKSHLRERFPETPIDTFGAGNLSNLSSLSSLNGMSSRDPEAHLVFRQIRRAIERGDGSEIYFESKVTELLCMLRMLCVIEAGEDKRAPRARSGRPLSDGDLAAVTKIKAVIEERVSNPPKIPELAALAATCAVKLQDDFKAAFGDTIHGYVQKVRMARALSEIENTDAPLSAISRSIGCGSPSRFSEIFRKTYGLTPGEYRKLKKR